MTAALTIMAGGIWGIACDFLGFRAFRSFFETLVILGPAIAALIWALGEHASEQFLGGLLLVSGFLIVALIWGVGNHLTRET